MIANTSLLGLKPNEQNDPKAIATKVQGLFMEQMLKSMEDSVDAEDGLFGNSSSSEIFRGMFREQMADAMSKRMDSPLEAQISTALQKASGEHTQRTDNSDDK